MKKRCGCNVDTVTRSDLRDIHVVFVGVNTRKVFMWGATWMQRECNVDTVTHLDPRNIRVDFVGARLRRLLAWNQRGRNVDTVASLNLGNIHVTPAKFTCSGYIPVPTTSYPRWPYGEELPSTNPRLSTSIPRWFHEDALAGIGVRNGVRLL